MKEGWTYKKLGEVCVVISGQSPDGKSYNSEGKGIPFYQGKKEFTIKYIGNPTTWTSEETKIALKDDILMSVRAPVGDINFATQRACIGRGLAAIRPNAMIDKDYLFYFLLSEKNNIKGKEGAVFPSINRKEIMDISISYPIISEQQRIVFRLDSAFAHIDELKANAEKQLSEARALFQKALTKAMEPKEGWEEKKIREISLIKGGKRVPQGYKLETEKTDYPYIRVADFTDEGTIDLSDIHYINNSVYQQIKNYTITDKDIYISIAGTIGKSGIIPSCLNGANLTENACKLVLNGGIEQRYVYWFTKSDEFKGQISLATRQTSQPKLALTRLAEVCISLPPLTEQRRIVSRLDSLSAHVRELEEVLQKTIAECDALKQALLRKVFE